MPSEQDVQRFEVQVRAADWYMLSYFYVDSANTAVFERLRTMDLDTAKLAFVRPGGRQTIPIWKKSKGIIREAFVLSDLLKYLPPHARPFYIIYK